MAATLEEVPTPSLGSASRCQHRNRKGPRERSISRRRLFLSAMRPAAVSFSPGLKIALTLKQHPRLSETVWKRFATLWSELTLIGTPTLIRRRWVRQFVKAQALPRWPETQELFGDIVLSARTYEPTLRDDDPELSARAERLCGRGHFHRRHAAG